MTTIYRGDTFALSVAWFKPNDANPAVEEAIVPLSAAVSVLRERDHKVVVSDAFAAITDNVTSFLVEGAALTIDGDYTAYLTAIFADGATMTRAVPFTVIAKPA